MARLQDAIATLELTPNRLHWTNNASGAQFEYSLIERLQVGVFRVNARQLLRATFQLMVNGRPDEIDERNLLHIVQGYLSTLLYRRFSSSRYGMKSVPVRRNIVFESVEIIVRHLRNDGRWSTFRYDGIEDLSFRDIVPVGSVDVTLHDHIRNAYQSFAEQLTEDGSDPDMLEILNIRWVKLLVRFRVLPEDNPLIYHTANVAPLVGVSVLPMKYVNILQTVGAVPSQQVSIRSGNAVLVGNVNRALTPWLPLGGCKDNVQDIVDMSALGRHRPDEAVPPLKRRRGNSVGVQLDLNNMRVWCPNVKNNNCFFACVKHACALEAVKDQSGLQGPSATERIDVWRKRLGVPMNQMISFREIDNFVRRIFHRVIDIFDEHGKLMARISPDQVDPNVPVLEFVLFRDHYFVLLDKTLERFHCQYCGRRNLRSLEGHKCAVARQKFFQLKKKKIVQFLDPLQDQELPVSEEILSTTERWPNILFFDFETFFDGAGHRVYAVGCLHWNEKGEEQYFSFYGEPALENFVMFLEHEFERDQALTLVSYNGAGFDHYFILEEQLKQLQTPDGFILSRGRLLQVNFWGHRCLDLYNFLGPASLDANCAAYQVPIRKHVFPHLFPRTYRDVEYRGPVLANEYYPVRMREEVAEWKSTLPADYVFDFEKECEFYLRRDVECLMELGKRFMKSVWDQFHIFLPNYLTLSQMAFDLWRGTLDKVWQLPLPVEAPFYNAVNSATYGGRCHFVKRHFRSAQPDGTPYAEIEDYLIDLDVVSLYPASMRGHLFPIGPYQHWQDEQSVRTWAMMFADGVVLPLAIWRVTCIPPAHLIVPALPKKHDEKKTTCWENTPSDSQWYTTIDLLTGRAHGYQFTFLEGYVWKHAAPVFDTYIDMMFQRKSEQDVYKSTKDPRYNPAARDVFKKLMNALYGKMMQKRQSTSHLFLETGTNDETHHDLWVDFLEDHMGVEYKELGDMLLVTGERVEFASGISKPHYLGAFVLSYSREIMNEYFDLLDPLRLKPEEGTWMDSMDNSFYYTDTDSLIVHAKHIPKMKSKMGSALGQLADELNGGKIVEGYFLSPKLYCVKYVMPDNSVHFKLRGKGIPNSMLHIDHFKRMLLENEPVKYEFTQLRKVQADLNSKQEEQGVRPFSIVSLLDASRTLNRDQNYAKAGMLGGRIVLDDVSLSLPVGFEKFNADIDDLLALLEDEQEENLAKDTALRDFDLGGLEDEREDWMLELFN